MPHFPMPRLLQDMQAFDIDTEKVLFVPLGAIEQHGRHLPVDTDSFLATAMCDALAEAVDGVVGPSFAHGCRSLPASGGGELFPRSKGSPGTRAVRRARDRLVEHPGNRQAGGDLCR